MTSRSISSISFVGQWLIVREVKTQIIRRNNRTSLLHVRSQNFTQRGMHQVGRGVIASRCIALFDINFSRNSIADFKSAFFNFDFVNDQTLRR